jgi:hypothetical protein
VQRPFLEQDLGPVNRKYLPLASWEKAARALCSHLASSQEYTYSLELRRHDRNADPVLDFLQNVKSGHCERFAGGLALMLRSVGVPARVVKGFRGLESQEEGVYAVRHSHAHSWVEVLVPREAGDGSTHMHWLALDPTPVGEGEDSFSLKDWWQRSHLAGYLLWRDFVVNYTREQQEGLLADVWSSLTREPSPIMRRKKRASPLAGYLLPAVVVLGPVLLAAGWWGWRRLRRRGQAAEPGKRAPRAAEVAVYTRLLAIVARRCRLRPRPEQTPREFSAAVEQLLNARAATAAVAAVPALVAALLYRVRYGGEPLAEDERQRAETSLAELDDALALAGRAQPV